MQCSTSASLGTKAQQLAQSTKGEERNVSELKDVKSKGGDIVAYTNVVSFFDFPKSLF